MMEERTVMEDRTTEERATHIRGKHGGDGAEVNDIEPRLRDDEDADMPKEKGPKSTSLPCTVKDANLQNLETKDFFTPLPQGFMARGDG
jgi:hypothetical protein